MGMFGGYYRHDFARTLPETAMAPIISIFQGITPINPAAICQEIDTLVLALGQTLGPTVVEIRLKFCI
jgi:hypothetical protein